MAEEAKAVNVEQMLSIEDKGAKKKKKADAPKEKKPRKPRTASHPPYFQMIKDALLALKEKSGSSPYAIAKFMEEKHKSVLPANFRKILALQLKNCVAKGKLIKVRASFKLSEAGKKAETTKTTGAKPKKASISKEKATASNTRSSSRTQKTVSKPEVAKKTAVKKTKTKPKQPKSIRSPAVKKAMKANASK